MTTRVLLAALLATVLVSVVAGQRAGSNSPTGASSPVADLSGDWLHSALTSISKADPRGLMRGKEPDVPYRPETVTRMMKEISASGGDGRFDATTDPHIRYCEPLGLVRMFNYPSKSRFVQTPEAVYILDEVGPTFRVVWLNAEHPDDPDPQHWGHSIGWYENGDTLVVDTVGVNDRSWLDGAAHPHTEQLHLIERFRRVDTNTLSYEVTVDDPGAYTRPWTSGPRNFTRSQTGFLRYQWTCSVRDMQATYDKVGRPASSQESAVK
jgi:hypothetical protein